MRRCTEPTSGPVETTKAAPICAVVPSIPSSHSSERSPPNSEKIDIIDLLDRRQCLLCSACRKNLIHPTDENLAMKRTKPTAPPDIATKIVSPADRAAAGKALRDKIPREHHGSWKEGKGRPNLIDILRKSDAGRMKELVPIRYGRM